ncbi:MAG TPA: DUF1684 domain-containing protein [Micrococcaceae bacterium]
MEPDPEAGAYATAVMDWRLQTFAMYAEVRETALLNPAAAHQLWRQRRDSLFRGHAASPLNDAKKELFTGLAVSRYDPAYRFEGVLTGTGAGEEMNVNTGTDGVVPFVRLGSFDVPGIGTLAVWRLRSYGAGRYLLDTVKGAYLGQRGGSFVLDFNFAYNPSCAYDEAWACPLPGQDNRLAVEIPVGELYRPELAD